MGESVDVPTEMAHPAAEAPRFENFTFVAADFAVHGQDR
jgi:hypothetical protein